MGSVRSRTRVDDGRWHHVAVAVRGGSSADLYIDGRRAGGSRLEVARHDEAGLPLKIGYCNENFPATSGFVGTIDEVRWYSYALSASELEALHAGY